MAKKGDVAPAPAETAEAPPAVRSEKVLLEQSIRALIVGGDLSRLSEEQLATYYQFRCEELGLSAASQPFSVLRLSGKLVLYMTRGGTDQLAAIHRLNRKIVDGPRVIDVQGTKVVYAMCEVTHPNGRFDTSIATLPLTDPTMVFMRAETKAKRRATLSILGLGMLDESEVEDIPLSEKSSEHLPALPAHSEKVSESRVVVSSPEEQPAQVPLEDAIAEDLVADSKAWLDHLAKAETVEHIAGSLQKRRNAMLEVGVYDDRKDAAIRRVAALHNQEYKVAEITLRTAFKTIQRNVRAPVEDSGSN